MNIDTENQHIHDYDPRTKKCRWCERPEHLLDGAWPMGTFLQTRLRQLRLAELEEKGS